MKKKFLSITVLFLINLTISANAANIIKVTSMDDFNTEQPSEKLNVKLRDNYNLGGYEFKTDDILECNVVKVVRPKRGKLNAKFYVEPYAYISGEEETEINTKMCGKYIKGVISKEGIKQLDKGKVAKDAALKVTSAYVKSVVPGVTIVKGMIKNEEDNIIKSGIKEAYKDSPLSRIEKGKDVYIGIDDNFCLLFKKVKHSKNTKNFIEEESEEDLEEEQTEETKIQEENKEKI